MENEKKFILNGQELTEEEFEERKKRLLETGGMHLVEVSPGVYKTRLFD